MRQTLMILAGTVCLIISCREKPAQPVPVSNTVDTVAAFVLQDTSVTKPIELPAELLPWEQAKICARVEGYVKEMKVDIGDRVHKGQTLAVIDAPELKTKYAAFQSSLQAARARYLSSLDLYQRLKKASQASTAGIVAPVELQRSYNQLLADSASWEASAKEAQSYKEVAGLLVLSSPFNGIVIARQSDPGALVGNNQELVTVQNNTTLRLRVAVPEVYIASGSEKKEISFRVDAYPQKIFQAKLSRKSGAIDPQTRTEQWEYSFSNDKGELKAGSFAYVKLNMQREGNSFLVSPASIVTNQERRFVIRIRNGHTEWVDVRQGMSTDKGIEIFGDIQKGDTLVSRATDENKPGTEVFVKLTK